MKTVTTVIFRDIDSDDEGVVIVRHDERYVGLGVSLKLNGDIEVVMGKDDARKVAEALYRALNG